MRQQHIVERLTGAGPVARENGELVRVMTYHLTTFRESIDNIEGLRSIRGYVDLEGFEAFDLIGQSLTLQLSDGRVTRLFHLGQ